LVTAGLAAVGREHARIRAQIAQRILYMSVRTVESQLTEAYRELGAKSRSQLFAAMARRDTTQAPP
jgi:DNA-binding CsgD family transcriptional regulator